MKRKVFNMVFLLCIIITIVGIYLIKAKNIQYPFLNENVVAVCLTIACIQGYYIYSKENTSKAYINSSQKDKEEEKKPSKSSIRLEDVAGLEEVKEEVMEIVDFISHSEKYKRMGAKLPKGILFYGPPGTGKTLLASALAGETNASFIFASGSEFMEKYVGVGAKRVRSLFEKARKETPCIVFIDEIDAIGGKRNLEHHMEGNQTLNQLLIEMDGFKEEKEEKPVILIGATNRLDILDPALLRPGRFDKHIYIGNPNRIAREQILRVHTKNKPLYENVDLSSIAIKTHGLSGAHIANIANEAAMFAVRNKRESITQEDFHAAIERVIAGLKLKNSTVSEKERKIIAYHEAGHALIGKILGEGKIEKISIIPTGQALGYVLNTQTQDTYLYTQNDLFKEVKILLGGRAAEEVIFHEITTGSKDDLDKATNIILDMICEYGMSNLGNRTFSDQMIHGNMGKINIEVTKNIDQCYEEILNILRKNKECLIRIAEYLFERETITGDELNDYIKLYIKN